jgi:hypothetical protein
MDDSLNRRQVLGIAGTILSGGIIGCQRSQSTGLVAPTRNVNRERIEVALKALLQRTNDDAFVIFEEKRSRKFVQFAGSARQDLMLDLPPQTLDQTEDARAEIYFRELGTRPVEDQSSTLEGKIVRQRYYQKQFGRDAGAAAAAAMGVFERVYQFPPDFDLVITEN